jgi:hypothetical protein
MRPSTATVFSFSLYALIRLKKHRFQLLTHSIVPPVSLKQSRVRRTAAVIFHEFIEQCLSVKRRTVTAGPCVTGPLPAAKGARNLFRVLYAFEKILFPFFNQSGITLSVPTFCR